MDFVEKAKVRLDHWIHHNDHHLEDYEGFAQELERAGKAESARHIREMIQYTEQVQACLRSALRELEPR